MADELDTTTRWMCPACGEVLETEYAQMQVSIIMHELRCPAKKKDDKSKDKENEERR